MPRPKKESSKKASSKKAKLQRTPSTTVPEPAGPSPIFKLPLEIFYMIGALLSKEELKRLRSTNSQIKEWVNPLLFASVGVDTAKIVECNKAGTGADFRAACVDRMYRAPYELQNSEILAIPKRFYFVIGHRTTAIRDRDFQGGISCLLRSFQTMLPRLLELFKFVEEVEVYLPVDGLRHDDSKAIIDALENNIGTRRLQVKLDGVTAARTKWLKSMNNMQSLSLRCADHKNRAGKAMVKLAQQAIQLSGPALEHLKLERFEDGLDDLLEGLRGGAVSRLRTLIVDGSYEKDLCIRADNLRKLCSLETLEVSGFSTDWLQAGSIWKELRSLRDTESKLRCLKIDRFISANLMEYLACPEAPKPQTLEVSIDTNALVSRPRRSTDNLDCQLTGTAFFERSLPNLQGTLHKLSFRHQPYLVKFRNWGGGKSRVKDYSFRAKHFNFRPPSHQGLRFSELRSLNAYLMYYDQQPRTDNDDKPTIFDRFMTSIQHSPKLREIHLVIETLDFAEDEDRWGVSSRSVLNDIENFRCKGESELMLRSSLQVEIYELISESKYTGLYTWDGTRWVHSGFIRKSYLNGCSVVSRIKQTLRNDIKKGRNILDL